MDVIRVVDVPVGTSTDEAQRLMNGPCAENLYMLVQVLPLPCGTTRAFYRMLGKAYNQRPEAATAELDAIAAEDAQALDFLKANLGKPSRMIADAFEKETGIVRSYKWFQRRRKDIGVTQE